MKRTGVIIILLILLLLSAGTNTYLYYDNKDSLAKKELEVVALRDSLQRELLRIEDSLNNVVMTLQQENTTLVSKITELEGPSNPRVVAAYSELNRIRRQLIQMTTNEGGGDINVQRNTKDVNLSGIRKQLADAKVKIKDLTAPLDT
jgi:chromatin segregation and condensation protein Rec8/ScpA/Scc1 (kleisin family)